jgi:DUF917 family protein
LKDELVGSGFLGGGGGGSGLLDKGRLRAEPDKNKNNVIKLSAIVTEII